MAQAATRGEGVALVPYGMFRRELDGGQLVRPFPIEVDVGSYWLTWLKSRTFADKNAGSGKTVSVSGIQFAGADAGNYALTIPTNTSASITPKPISVTVAASDKIYDGSVTATGSAAVTGVIGGDAASLTAGTYAFSDKTAAASKTVSVSGITLAGGDASNYALSVPATALASITPKALSATVAANNKVYDGSTATTGAATLSGGVVAGDLVALTGGAYTFSDKNAGASKTVTVAGVSLSGGDAANYSLSIPASTTASTLTRALTIGLVRTSTKTYDGSTVATLTSGNYALTNVVAGDSVSAGSNGSAAYDTANAGSNKTVAVNGVYLSGADASNYTVASSVSGAIGRIDPRSIIIAANNATKLNGTVDPAFTSQITSGSLVTSDALTGALSRASGETPGSYAINQGSLATAPNYLVSTVRLTGRPWFWLDWFTPAAASFR